MKASKALKGFKSEALQKPKDDYRTSGDTPVPWTPDEKQLREMKKIHDLDLKGPSSRLEAAREETATENGDDGSKGYGDKATEKDR